MASDIHGLNLEQNTLFDSNSQTFNSFSPESTDYSTLANLNPSSNDLSISSLSLDVDGNGIVEANRDGLLIYGYLNVRNIPVPSLMDQLADNLADPDGIRNSGADIRDFLGDYLEINEAPGFQIVDDLTVMPGDRLEVQLTAVDPEGEDITFALQGEDLPAGSLSPDGKLVFNPNPDELGEYEVTLIASDGEVETSQVVNLSVIVDPLATTRLTGIIADVDETP